MKKFLPIIGALWLAGCSLPTKTVDTPVPPFISFAAASLAQIDVGHIAASVDTLIVVTATAQGTDIQAVTAIITTPDGSTAAYALADNGVYPDQRKNDGIYTGTIALQLSKSAVGTYSIHVQAAGASGLTSNIQSLPLSIISSNNQPPIISALIAPDTVHIPTGATPNYLTVSIAVNDPDGLETIQSVSFASYRPNGSIVASYPMYDDGGTTVEPAFNDYSGDTKAGDGRYTLRIPITSDLTPTYRDFVFSAKDKSGAISNLLTKRIYIQ